MQSKLILIPALIFAVSLTLSACQNPSSMSEDVEINLGGQPAETTDQTTNQATNQAANPSNQLPESNNMPTAEPVKKLADFAPIEGDTILLETSKGAMTLRLYTDQAPLTTTNFKTLVNNGFYDGQVFHRVIADFMAQVGDPLTKDPAQQARWGTGGPGYTIEDEIVPELKHDREGLLSMANTGQPNSGGSQIFMTFAPTPWLDGKHAVFGEVTEGLEVLRALKQGDTIVSAKIQP